MSVQVLDVGDGACTVVRGNGQTMVIDCGALHDKGDRSASRLVSAIGMDPAHLSTIVVSHFDADHWNGLEKAPDVMTGSSLPIRLIYPRHPAAAAGLRQMLVAVLAAMNVSPHGNAIKLEDAWRRSFPNLTKHALVRGDRFEAAGRRWSVHWPPRRVDDEWSKAFATVRKRVQRLADENTDLRAALERAFDAPEPDWDPLELDGRDGEEDIRFSDDLLSDVKFDDVSILEDAATPHKEDGDEGPLGQVYRELQALNNSLSLVIGDDAGELLAFGDIEKWGLRRLLLMGGLPGAVDIVLAPHHGTQVPGVSVRRRFPRSARTIAQRGHKHEQKAKEKGYDAIWRERTGQLHSTQSRGDFIAEFNWFPELGPWTDPFWWRKY